jgi:hypothetical protein
VERSPNKPAASRIVFLHAGLPAMAPDPRRAILALLWRNSMRKLIVSLVLGLFAVALVAAPVAAQEKKKPDQDAQFKRLDKDSDGKLTEAELVAKKTGEAADKAKARFAKLDANKDGSVTLEEFKAGGKKK